MEGANKDRNGGVGGGCVKWFMGEVATQQLFNGGHVVRGVGSGGGALSLGTEGDVAMECHCNKEEQGGGLGSALQPKGVGGRGGGGPSSCADQVLQGLLFTGSLW